MVWVQFPGIPSYDEDQVALVIRDGSEFSWRIPVDHRDSNDRPGSLGIEGVGDGCCSRGVAKGPACT